MYYPTHHPCIMHSYDEFHTLTDCRTAHISARRPRRPCTPLPDTMTSSTPEESTSTETRVRQDQTLHFCTHPHGTRPRNSGHLPRLRLNLHRQTTLPHDTPPTPDSPGPHTQPHPSDTNTLPSRPLPPPLDTAPWKTLALASTHAYQYGAKT